MILKKLFVFLAMLTVTTFCFAQETTGSLQGTIKDPTGAVVPGAKVTVTAPSLVGEKSVVTDGKGYYHFSNLPPGNYVVTVEEKGFTTRKQEGLTIEVGHSPSLDMTLAIGSQAQVVEVTSESPAIDVTTVTTQTNVTQDVIDYVPHGLSFQSVIQFAPAASNEPLMGSTMLSNGSGGTSPGNGSNGSPYGYSIAGGSDSENSYLVEGQETANLIGGYSHTNVPFDFIDQVQVKTSGIVAQYGGALGGVVDVIMQKGTAHYHGSVFSLYESQGLDATPSATSRYDPNDPGTNTSWGYIDPVYQSYQPQKTHYSIVQPGFTIGGPLIPTDHWRDKLFFFVGFNPQLQRNEVKLNYGTAADGGAGYGIVPFSQNTNTYYTTARLDAQVSQKIRVFGSWLYQLQKQYGESTPGADSSNGLYNGATGCFSNATSTTTPCLTTGILPSVYSHATGYTAPNITVNTGADITVTPHIVSTTRFGYYFENYHDFGYPRDGVLNFFETSGTPSTGATDVLGDPLPAVYQQSAGYINAPATANFTQYNASKAIQLDETVSWYKSTPFGQHNFAIGYSLNRLSNTLYQTYNEPIVDLYVGFTSGSQHEVQTADGAANCASYAAMYGQCQGQYGYFNIFDAGTHGSAISYNHSIFAQDSWTLGKGITIDAGVRVEKEFLPGEAAPGPNVPDHPINFGWGDKVSPRVGAAWDVFKNGKMKVFGSYGVFRDQMKLNLAISSFGGQYWQNCYYTLGTANLSSIDPTFASGNGNRDCVGPDDTSTANFAGLPAGTSPAGTSFIENLNYRAFPTTCSTCSATEEGVAPGLKPYTQHESVFGTDYQLSRTLSLEARWDRRRLDHVIEDSAIYNPTIGETFVIINPGQGVDSTFTKFCQFEAGAGNPGCAYPYPGPAGEITSGPAPPNQTIPAARSYDGVELRLNKALSQHWSGLFSYTYSHFRGNYTGLTSSDLADAGGGRNSPNNSRSFDEAYFQYNDNGGSSSGNLPTDRPNKFKGYAYYRLDYLKKFETDFGLFQTIYQGSPNTSYTDVGDGPGFPVDVVNRGKWVNVTQNESTGAVTVSNPLTYRNPWYKQSDFNITETYKVTDSKTVSFVANFTNILNEHAVTAVNSQINSGVTGTWLNPQGYFLGDGVAFYGAATQPYNLQAQLNSSTITDFGETYTTTINSQYGKPLFYQLPRTLRLRVSFTF